MGGTFYLTCSSILVTVLLVGALQTTASEKVLEGDTFDFIVVGAGTGGCTVAGRLAENGKYSVLLIGEGGLPHPDLEVPALTSNPTLLGDPSILKVYQGVPQNNSGQAWNGSLAYIIGQPLGGGSAVNGMWMNRGHPETYNEWGRSTGDDSWNHANLLKYFRKFESYVGNNPSDQRGFNGPITVSRQYYAPGLQEWFEGGVELGYPIRDPNGPQIESFSWIDYSRRHGRRISSFKGYVEPLLRPNFLQSYNSPRRNLIVRINTVVNRILFEGNQAVGVRFTTNSSGVLTTGYARASKEIIISAGVMDSPTILMRSGIGPKDVLEEANIPVVKYLPVGSNLQDHVIVMSKIIFGNSSVAFAPERDFTPEAWNLYQLTGDGPYSSYLGGGGQAFLSSSVSSPSEKYPGWPDIHLMALNTNGSLPVPGVLLLDTLKEGEIAVTWDSILVRPKSRGTVSLNVTNIDSPPIIDFQYLAHPDDVRAIIDGIKVLNKLCEDTLAFKRIGCRTQSTPLPACNHLKFRSDPYWECYVRQSSTCGIHAGGTCKLGRGPEDPTAVVNGQLRVIGIKGLRVADASVFPEVTNANTQGPVYAIAEKAADMVLKTWGGDTPSVSTFPLLNL